MICVLSWDYRTISVFFEYTSSFLLSFMTWCFLSSKTIRLVIGTLPAFSASHFRGIKRTNVREPAGTKSISRQIESHRSNECFDKNIRLQGEEKPKRKYIKESLATPLGDSSPTDFRWLGALPGKDKKKRLPALRICKAGGLWFLIIPTPLLPFGPFSGSKRRRMFLGTHHSDFLRAIL